MKKTVLFTLMLIFCSCNMVKNMKRSNELLEELNKETRETKEEMKKTNKEVVETRKQVVKANENLEVATSVLLDILPTLNQINGRVQTLNGQIDLLNRDLTDLAEVARMVNEYSQDDRFKEIMEKLKDPNSGVLNLYENASELLEKLNRCTVEVFRPEYMPQEKKKAQELVLQDYKYKKDLVWDKRGYYIVPAEIEERVALDHKELITRSGSFCEKVSATALLNATRTVMHLGELFIDSGMADQVEMPSSENASDVKISKTKLFDEINKENIKENFKYPETEDKVWALRNEIKDKDAQFERKWRGFAENFDHKDFLYGSEEADRLILTHYQPEVAVYKMSSANSDKSFSRRDYIVGQLNNYLPYGKLFLTASDKSLLGTMDKMIIPFLKIKTKHPYQFSAQNMAQDKRGLVKVLRNILKFYYGELQTNNTITPEQLEAHKTHIYTLITDMFYYYYDTEYTLFLLDNPEYLTGEKQTKRPTKKDEKKEEEGGILNYFRGWKNPFGSASSTTTVSRSIASVKKKAHSLK